MNPKLSRRALLRGSALAAVAGVSAMPWSARAGSLQHGQVFTSSNAPGGNEVLVFMRSASGGLEALTRVATGGAGSGGGLGSQGALALSRNGHYLFVVNAASHTVSTLQIVGQRIELMSVVDSGGLTPTSVAEHHGLVAVLNAGGSGNVAMFRNEGGTLVPVAPGRALSAQGGTAPAQVGFSPDGDAIVVSERNTNLLSSYPVLPDGRLGARQSTASPGLTPFGFAFSQRGHLVVSEAGGGVPNGSSASSYRFDERSPATPLPVSRAVPTTQSAACWAAVTPDGRFAYTSNAASSSISSFGLRARAEMVLLQAQAGLTGPNAGALDCTVSADGSQLHVLASRALQIVSFDIGEDGSLTRAGAVGGLATGMAGLIAN